MASALRRSPGAGCPGSVPHGWIAQAVEAEEDSAIGQRQARWRHVPARRPRVASRKPRAMEPWHKPSTAVNRGTQDLVGIVGFRWTSGRAGRILRQPISRGREGPSREVVRYAQQVVVQKPARGSGGYLAKWADGDPISLGGVGFAVPHMALMIAEADTESGRLVRVGETRLPVHVREQVHCSHREHDREASPRCSERGVQVCR